MAAQANIPYLTLTFNNAPMHAWQTNQIAALVSTSSPHSTMELSTLKQIFPHHSLPTTQLENIHKLLNHPLKAYSIISAGSLNCTFYLTNEHKQTPITTDFHIINDPGNDRPDIVLGSNCLFDKSQISHLTADGIHLNDSQNTLIPYSHITRTLNPIISLNYQMLSPHKAKVRTTRTQPFHHQHPK